MALSSVQRAHVASSLDFGLCMNVELTSGGSWTGSGRILHPAAPECARMVWEWLDEYDGDAEGCLSLLTAASRLGYPGAMELLAEDLTCFIDQYPEYFADFGFDQTISNALDELEYSQHFLSLETLQRCVQVSRANAASTALSMIASYANREALRALLQLQSVETEYFIRDRMIEHTEALAGRLGVRITWDGNRLAVA